ERIFIGAPLDIVWLPAPTPIAVGIIFKSVAVFIYLSITVIVFAFEPEYFIIAFFVGAYRYHPARIGRIYTQSAIGIFAAHDNDLAIAVEIIIAIFIDQAIAVIVYRYYA